MSITGIRDTSRADLGTSYGVAVARKSLDAQQQDGKTAIKLIEASAAPPVRPGHSLSVVR
ncbi:hypothetical protein BH11MYX4_BH11MYX4_48390 [soil metagenome]